MPNPNPKTEQLPKYQPKWKHQPTKAIRVPEVFLGEIEEYARQLDEGREVVPSPKTRQNPKKHQLYYAALESPFGDPENLDEPDSLYDDELNAETILDLIKQLDNIDDLLTIKKELEPIIWETKRRSEDQRLEAAILFLGESCDGAISNDKTGFNSFDTEFGHWLSNRISQNQPLREIHAKAALEMLQKYLKTQLEPNGYSLPEWEAISHQYSPFGIRTKEDIENSKREKRLELLSNKIAVYAPYDKTGEFQKNAKTIKGYDFDNDKSWRYPAEKIGEIIETFDVFNNGYYITDDIHGLITIYNQQQAEEEVKRKEEEERRRIEAEEAAEENIKLFETANVDQPLPCGLSLFNHQKEAVKWLLVHRKKSIYRGGILADHMGLGKTLSALAAAKVMKAVFNCHVFVIAPSSLRDNWLEEAKKTDVKIEIFSWAKIPKPVDTAKFLIIVDEAHFAQSLTSQRTQKLLELAAHDNCLATWLLTGTPIKNGRPINLFPLLKAIAHPLANNQKEYEEHYCSAYYRPVKKGWVWDNSGAAHLEELAEKTSDVILRRTKNECLDLPPKIRSFKTIELEKEDKKAYKKEIDDLVKDYWKRVKEGLVDDGAEALVKVNYLRRVGSKYKVREAIAIASELLEQDQPVVIFTEFVDSAKAVYAALGGELLTGETPVDERSSIVNRFQSSESRVLTATTKTGGTGLTLTAASNVVLIDRPWTPGDAEQAEDRLHRIGAKSTVNSFWIQLGIIDEAIDSLLESKQERINLVLKGKASSFKGVGTAKELAKELMEILI